MTKAELIKRFVNELEETARRADTSEGTKKYELERKVDILYALLLFLDRMEYNKNRRSQ